MGVLACSETMSGRAWVESEGGHGHTPVAVQGTAGVTSGAGAQRAGRTAAWRAAFEQALAELERIELAPLAAGLLSAVTEKNRHQRLLDELLGALEKVLSNEETLAALREKIRQELPAFVERINARVMPSSSEEVRCLNIDWFEF